mgnify:CR=1 FL=1
MSPKQQTGLMEKPKAEMILKKGGTWHSYQYTTKDAALIISDYQETYHVEPKRGHLMVVENMGILTPYITKSGHACIANAAQISTKIKIDKIHHGTVSFAMVTATAVLPDGTSHEAIGYSDTSEKGRDKINKCISMASTRARNNAIDIAMEIQSCAFEEFNESDEMKKRAMDITDLQEEILTICPECKEKGWSRLQKRCKLCKITYEAIVGN